ncbi:uncharacterized protein F5147DRAFT_784186 [Suillus discolor]|uniref:Uncharacterized protein n=1 Tax=Suillus discolor TaxID=1912936 RepID=A0A9P7EPX4_9AGAM|nr:uncharacterized protein F5147DRAFT_784186 [Suillus discolor]KAG2080575.1 hypothetical protein F5147DRAFT_784186 [Suillus discolor]
MKLTTLAQLAVVHSCADPVDLEAFFCEVQKFHLNGVAEPFFQDWILAEPSHFFTPETLHHLHKEFLDHDAQCYHHFPGGISKLKQVTGCCQQDMQQYIIAVWADAAPACIITALHVLMQFRYLIQSPHLDDDDLKYISGTLHEFHVCNY